jgi:hypothetical protein
MTWRAPKSKRFEKPSASIGRWTRDLLLASVHTELLILDWIRHKRSQLESPFCLSSLTSYSPAIKYKWPHQGCSIMWSARFSLPPPLCYLFPSPVTPVTYTLLLPWYPTLILSPSFCYLYHFQYYCLLLSWYPTPLLVYFYYPAGLLPPVGSGHSRSVILHKHDFLPLSDETFGGASGKWNALALCGEVWCPLRIFGHQTSHLLTVCLI